MRCSTIGIVGVALLVLLDQKILGQTKFVFSNLHWGFMITGALLLVMACDVRYCTWISLMVWLVFLVFYCYSASHDNVPRRGK